MRGKKHLHGKWKTLSQHFSQSPMPICLSSEKGGWLLTPSGREDAVVVNSTLAGKRPGARSGDWPASRDLRSAEQPEATTTENGHRANSSLESPSSSLLDLESLSLYPPSPSLTGGLLERVLVRVFGYK